MEFGRRVCPVALLERKGIAHSAQYNQNHKNAVNIVEQESFTHSEMKTCMNDLSSLSLVIDLCVMCCFVQPTNSTDVVLQWIFFSKR